MKNWLFIGILVLFSACGGSKTLSSHQKNIDEKISSQKLNRLVKKNAFETTYFSSKIRILFNQERFTASLRMKKNEVIWIRFTGLLGLEGARLKIYPTHFELIDHINRKYYKQPLSELKQFLPIDADFALLQNIIWGNFLEKNISKQNIQTDSSYYQSKSQHKSYTAEYFFTAQGKLAQANINYKQPPTHLQLSYHKFEKVDNQDFALIRKFKLQQQDKKNNVNLKFYKYKKEKKLDFPFQIPKNYTQ